MARLLSAFGCFCLSALLLLSPAFAADITSTWLGGDGNWSDSTKWSSSPNLPNNGNGGATYDVVIDHPNNGTVTLDQDIVIDGLNLGFSVITGNFNLTLKGNSHWDGGALWGNGTTTLTSTSVIDLRQISIEQAVINNGSIQWSQTGSGSSLRNTTFLNNGSITTHVPTSNGFSRISNNIHNTTSTFTNAGTFSKTGPGQFSVDFLGGGYQSGILFDNSGAVGVQAGILRLDAGGTHTGEFNIATGLEGGLILRGQHQFNPNATITGTGTIAILGGTSTFDNPIQFSGQTLLNTGGIAAFNNDANFNTLTLTSGNLTGTGKVTVTGNSTWSGGTMSGTGQTVVDDGGTLAIGSNSHFLSRTLVNKGTTTWTNGTLEFVNGLFQNLGEFIANSNSTLYASGTAGANGFENAGVFTKVGTGTAVFYNFSTDIPFNNTGTIDVHAGTLHLQSNVVTQISGSQMTDGIWKVRSNATLIIEAGSNITTNLADVTLDGPGSTFVKIDTLADNQGSFSILNGRNFTPVGAFSNTGRLVVSGGSTFTANSVTQHVGSTLTGGTWHVGTNGNLNFTSGANITTNQGDVTFEGIGSTFAKIDSLTNNQGSFSILAGRNFTAAGAFSNSGTVTVSGDSTFTAPSVTQLVGSELTAGAWHIGPTATLDIQSGSNITINSGSVTLDGGGSTFAKIETLTDNRGSFSIMGGRDFTPVASFTNSGTLTIGEGSTFNAANGYVHQATAKLKGTGTFLGNFQNSGTLAPGNSPGIIEIDGDYIQTASGTLEIEVGGLTEGTQHDQVVVTGEAELAGRLIVPIVDVLGEPDYVPAIDDEIAFLKTTNGVSGKFESLSAPNLKSVSNLAIKVFRTLDEKEVHLKFVMPTNVTFTDTNDANWDTNISWSTSAVPDTDNIVIVRNNAIGGDQRVEVETANAFTDQLLVADPDAKITVGIHDGLSLSAVSNSVTIGNNGAIELGVGPGSAGGTLVGSTVAIESGGTLSGNGTVVGDVVVGSGGMEATFDPGFSVGHVNLQGNYKQQTGGTLLIDVEGESTGEFDTVNVSGALELGGTLRIDATNLTMPAPGTTFEIIAGGNLAEGEIFDSVETIGNNDIFFAPIYDTLAPGSGSDIGGGGTIETRVAVGVYNNGDMNRNGLIDEPDVQAFAVALTKPIQYFSSFYIFGNESGDLNNDGRLDFDDIDGFAALVQGTGATAGDIARAIERELNPVPEPSSVGLLFTCAAMLFVARRNAA